MKEPGYTRGLKEGHAEGESIAKSEIVKNMLKKGYDDNVILELTNITKSDLEKIKNEL